MPTPSQLRQTHTVATLGVPANVYNWIAAKLCEHSYHHVFMEGGEIDMTGIALAIDLELPPATADTTP